MPRIKVNISNELNKVRHEFSQVMVELFHVPVSVLRSCPIGWMPAVDIYEDAKALYVVADLAGVDSDSLELVVEGEFLRVSGSRKPPISISEKKFFQMEVEYGPFERVIRIPLPVKLNDINAKLENGLLIVRFNKKDSKKMTIEVK